MDKAKAYDEALERARKQRDDYQKELDKTDKNSQLAGILRGAISAVEMAFPELTESEDEKIRKSLIEFLTDIKEISESGRTVWAVRKEDIEMCKSSIAYLEKQKEQKPISNTYGCLNCTKLEECKKGLTPCSEHRLKIVEPKPVEPSGKLSRQDYLYQLLIDQLITYSDYEYLTGKNPAWSEEDKHNLNSVINLVHTTTDGAWGSCIGDRIENWLKNLPERFVLQLNQEWSEEDKKRVKQLIYDTEHIRAEYEKRKKELGESFNDELIKDCDEQIAWLKDIFLNHKKFNEAVDKLCSNEWSEEDERMLSRCIKSVECSKQFADSETYKAAKDAEMNWLQSLSERFNLRLKQEWSEDYWEEDIQTRFAFYTYKDDSSVLYLSNVFVEETSRNHGFGTKILIAAEKVAETIGATTISLKVKQDSPANAWYRKNGYGYVAFEDGYDWLEKNLEYMKPNHNTLPIEQQMEAAMIAIRGETPSKPQEWNEEDERTINDACCFLGEYAGYIGSKNWGKSSMLFSIIDKLKSLYPYWKSSEEQEESKYYLPYNPDY